MSKKLTGKVAIVTGASKGIGAAIAEQLGAEGAYVVVNYASSKEGADHVVTNITNQGGKAIAVQADLSNPEDIRKLFETTMKEFKKLDILINNAGVYDFVALEEITPEHFHKLFNLNVLGLILSTQEAAKHMSKSGSVVNISSIASTSTPATSSVYSATKAAVDAVTRTLSKELGPRQIRVNSVNPGMVETEGVHSKGFDESDFRNEIESHTPLKRIGKPTDIAPIVAFLSSDDANWITGETFYVSGGYR